MPSTINCKSGDIVLVPFPFANLKSQKKRPALILANLKQGTHLNLVVIAMITSQMKGAVIPGDVNLQQWDDSGLPKPSKVRVAKVVTVDSELVLKKIGKLTAKDTIAVRKAFGDVFEDWT